MIITLRHGQGPAASDQVTARPSPTRAWQGQGRARRRVGLGLRRRDYSLVTVTLRLRRFNLKARGSMVVTSSKILFELRDFRANCDGDYIRVMSRY